VADPTLTPERRFLGTGWAFPPSFSRATASVEMVSGEKDVRESIWMILSTQLGERVMLPTFGCAIWAQVFATINTALTTRLRAQVENALLNWEPRITVDRVTVTASPGSVGILDIAIDYTIRKTNARSNLVYPFYILEATIAPPAP